MNFNQPESEEKKYNDMNDEPKEGSGLAGRESFGDQRPENPDPREDSGHVSNKPGYGWEDNRHLAGDRNISSEVTKVPVTPVSSPRDDAAPVKPQHGTKSGGPSWHFWWLLFILLILGLIAVAGFQIWDTKLIRNETLQAESTLHERIDATDTQSQNRLQTRATNLEVRIDQLAEKVTQLQVENAALKAKLESTQLLCERSCQQIEK